MYSFNNMGISSIYIYIYIYIHIHVIFLWQEWLTHLSCEPKMPGNPALYALRSGQTTQQTMQSNFNPGRERYCPPSENSTRL